MSERQFAGLHRPAADERRDRSRVLRTAKRPAAAEAGSAPRGRFQAGDFQGLESDRAAAATPAIVARAGSCPLPEARSSAAHARPPPRFPERAWRRIGRAPRRDRAAPSALVTSRLCDARGAPANPRRLAARRRPGANRCASLSCARRTRLASSALAAGKINSLPRARTRHQRRQQLRRVSRSSPPSDNSP